MRRKTKLNICVVIFLCFAILVAIFILQRDKGNSFEIGQNDTPTNTRTDTNAPDKAPKPETPPAEEEKPSAEETKAEVVDLSPLVEEYKGKEIIKINTDQKVVALTFDAGANADGVDKVLPILADNDITGTFFLTGKFIEKYPAKVQEIMATGADIGNHTYDHPYLTHLTEQQIQEKIQGAETAFAKLNGKFSPLLRSPYGDRNASTLLTISNAGYINIRWTIDSLGWKGTSGGQSKTLVEQKVLKASGPGAIIMMHLGSNPDDKTHLDSEALPTIISKLKADGYEFKTLSEMLELEK